MNEMLEKYIELIARCLGGYRHKNYYHTINKAIFYNQIVTGENQEALIVSYKERESDAQKIQRIKLTHKASKGVANQIITQFDKVKRVKPTIKVEVLENENQQQILVGQVSNFAGRTLHEYIFDMAKFYNSVDPNAWLVLGYTGEVNEQGTIEGEVITYPVEVVSSNVWDYNYTYSQLDYLITGKEEMMMIMDDKGERQEEVVKIVMYVPQYQINLETYVQGVDYGTDAQVIEIAKDKYVLEVVEVGGDKIPAMRFGYIPDYSTNTETYVSFFDAASEDFKELINVNSEYSLTRALHTFLQKFQVAEPCDYMPDGQSHNRCHNGRLLTSKETCPSCEGKGIKVHTTTQDVMFVKRVSKDDETYVPLSEMAKYIEMPFDIVDHQHKLTKELPQKISVNVFGIDIHNRPNNATATEIRNFYNSLYDTLSPFAKKISELFIFSASCIADNSDVENEVITHQYPQDFKLMSISELLIELKQAKDAGASQDIIQSIEQEIKEKQNQDTPQKVALSNAKEKFRPFKNLSDQQVLLEIANAPNDNYFVLAYKYHDVIFERIQSKINDFELRPYEQQKSLVDNEIEVLKQELATSTPADVLRSDIQIEDDEQIQE